MAQTGLEIAALTPAPSVLGLQDAPPAGFSTCLHTVKQTTSSLLYLLAPWNQQMDLDATSSQDPEPGLLQRAPLFTATGHHHGNNTPIP